MDVESAAKLDTAPVGVTSVLVADDDEDIRVALAEVIASEPSLQLAGTAETGAEAVRLAGERDPDVAIVDVRMGEGGGLAVARALASSRTRVIALSAYDDRAKVLDMLEAGAEAYLVKGAPVQEIVDAVRLTADNGGIEVARPSEPVPALEVATAPCVQPDRPETGPFLAGPVRVIIADNSADVLDALSELIDSDPSLELAGTATDAVEAIRLAGLYRPHVALLDWRMPGGGGTVAAREIRRCSPETRIVALSSQRDPDIVMSMLQAGATSYVVKSISGAELSETVRRSARGEGLLSPEVTAPVIEQLVVGLKERRHDVERRRRDIGRIREVLEGAALSTVFQPIVALATGRVVAAEALARFDTRTRWTPDVWFREAARVGLGVELDFAAATRAVSQLGQLPEDVRLHVNLIPETILSGRAGEALASAPPERLVVELTEHTPIRDYAELNRALAPLREAGVGLAVDDVGAGFASMRHLLTVAPDQFKLDVSICRSVDTEKPRAALAGALMSFAHEVGAEVVAEGVETAGELEALRALGADFVQGFHLGRPRPLPFTDVVADVPESLGESP